MLHYVDEYPTPQDALNAAAADYADTAVVLFPPALYHLPEPLIASSRTRLEAYGAVLRGCGNYRLLRSFRPTDSWPAYAGPTRIEVAGGTWDANGAEAADGTVAVALNFCHATDITVRDVTVLNVPGGHAIEFSAVAGGSILDCTFRGFLDTGEREFSEAVQLGRTKSAASVDIGEYDDTPCRDIAIRGCRVGASGELPAYGALVGDHGFSDDVFHDGIIVTSNHVEGTRFGVRPIGWRNFVVALNVIRDTDGTAILCQRSQSGLIGGNIIDRPGSNGINLGGSTDVLCLGNVVMNSATNYGAYLGRMDGTGPATMDSLLSANLVRGGALAAVRLAGGADGNAIMGNLMRRGSGLGHHALSRDAGSPATSNRFEDNDVDGFDTTIGSGNGTITTE